MVILVLILLARCDVNNLDSYNIQRTGKRYYRSHDAFYTSCKPGFPALRSNIVLMCNNAKWTGLDPLPCTVGNENCIFSIKNLLVYLILFWLNLYKLPVTDLNGEKYIIITCALPFGVTRNNAYFKILWSFHNNC